MTVDLASLQGWMLTPPQAARPLRQMLFAHPEIVGDVVEALGPLASASATIPSIYVDRNKSSEWWSLDGYTAEHEGDWVERGNDEWSPESTTIKKQHWECPREWAVALARFRRLLEDGELVLIGRAGSALAPGALIPFNAIASGSFDTGETFASGIVELVDGTKAYDVHLVQSAGATDEAPFLPGPGFEASIRKMRSEIEMRDWLASLMQAYPTNKPTSKAALLMMLDEFGVTKGSFRRAWDAACASVGPEIAAHWRSPGTLKKTNRSAQSIPEI